MTTCLVLEGHHGNVEFLRGTSVKKEDSIDVAESGHAMESSFFFYTGCLSLRFTFCSLVTTHANLGVTILMVTFHFALVTLLVNHLINNNLLRPLMVCKRMLRDPSGRTCVLVAWMQHACS